MEIPDGGWNLVSHRSRVVAPIHQENLPIAFVNRMIEMERSHPFRPFQKKDTFSLQEIALRTALASLMRESTAIASAAR
jgi:hypothetical protein